MAPDDELFRVRHVAGRSATSAPNGSRRAAGDARWPDVGWSLAGALPDEVDGLILEDGLHAIAGAASPVDLKGGVDWGEGLAPRFLHGGDALFPLRLQEPSRAGVSGYAAMRRAMTPAT